MPRTRRELGGGHVLEPRPGLYTRTSSCSTSRASTRASSARSRSIPSSLLRPRPAATPTPSWRRTAPPSAASRGILPEHPRRASCPRREAAKRAGDAVKSQAIKILMNSFYGVPRDPRLPLPRPAPGQRHHQLRARGAALVPGRASRPRAAASSTATPTASSWSRARPTPDEARRLGEELAARAQPRARRPHPRRPGASRAGWSCSSSGSTCRLFLPAVRHGTAGARKRYVGLVGARTDGPRGGVHRDGGRCAATGPSWREEVQRELYARLFADAPVEEYLREVVAAGARRPARRSPRLPQGAAQGPRGLHHHHPAPRRRGAQDGTPRARPDRLRDDPRRAGARAERQQLAIDYEHYVEKQVRPVAEPVLALLGLDFAKVTGSERQLSLFE